MEASDYYMLLAVMASLSGLIFWGLNPPDVVGKVLMIISGVFLVLALFLRYAEYIQYRKL